MAATIEICESNGAGEVIQHNITNTNMGSTDAPNLNPVTYPVVPDDNTFEKWQRFHVTAMGGSSSIQNLKVWRTGALGGSAVHLTNARTTSYGGAKTYAQPTASDSSIATQTMPSSVPASANLGIAGALAGALIATGYSDYLIHQVQTDAADVAGSTSTLNFQYDEVA
jgi:hypothetical protein